MSTIWSVIVSILSLVGIGTAVPAIILFLLQRRNANKKLEIEEDTLSVNVFNAQTKAYQDLLDRADRTTQAALAELKTYQAERKEILKKVDMQNEVLELTNTNLQKIRTLFQAVVKRSNIVLTPAEQKVFDETKPIELVRRLKAQTGR